MSTSNQFFSRQIRDLLYLLVLKELKVRYKNSILGYMWALANPFAFALVYYFAFKIIMRVQIENYSLYLITGIFPWLWMTNSIMQATSVYKSHSSLVKKVNLHRGVLPLSYVVQEMVHFYFAIPIIILFIFISLQQYYFSWIWQIPIMSLMQLALIYPIALIFALANVFVRDIEHIVSITFSLLFFLTPIVYPISIVPDNYRIFMELNPFFFIIENWRAVLMSGDINYQYAAISLFYACVFGFVSYHYQNKYSSRIGELL